MSFQSVIVGGINDSLHQGYFQGILLFSGLGFEIHSVFEFEVIIHSNTVFFSAEIPFFSYSNRRTGQLTNNVILPLEERTNMQL